ncbi:MAG TPA: DNA polymerase III subunit delta [Candidatus Polarisedimenticolia bacterium]|nr:DNA polymerase III subunit delta [Candidatus Polarisedimenticolia bacterium]
MGRTLSFGQLQQALVRGALEPVYLFEGAEEFFHEEGFRLLEAAALPAGTAVTDRDALRGAEIALPALLDLAETYPMGGGRRLIVVRQADDLRADDLEPLKAYLARPNPRTCLVFSDAKFDGRRGLGRALAAGGVRVDCAPLDETRTALWVRERLRGGGFGISAELAEAITAGYAGGGLAGLDAELSKLMSALGAPRPVEPKDLAILAGVPRVEDAFRVAMQAIRGERGEAVAATRALLRAGEDPVRMLGGISWYVRNALRARSAAARRVPPRELRSLYDIDPGRIERFEREVGRADVAGLRETLALCLRADRELKGQGAKDPAHALERLIHGAGRHRGGRG